MTDLHSYLQHSAERDADGSWSWEGLPEMRLLGREQVGSWLEKQPDHGKAIQIVPISGWYPSDPVRRRFKTMAGIDPQTPSSFAEECAKQFGITFNPSIHKLLFTDATSAGSGIKDPSWFVSPEKGEYAIHPGQEFILADDLFVSYGTIRDLIKHITLRGGVVKAVIDMSHSNVGVRFERDSIRETAIEECASRLYCLEHHLPNKLDEIDANYGRDGFAILGLSVEEKSAYLDHMKAQANTYLGPIGLGWQQLTRPEWSHLSYCIDSAMNRGDTLDAFWRKTVRQCSPALPAPIDQVTRQEQLSEMLGTEFQPIKWIDGTRNDHPRIAKIPPNQLGL